MGADFRTCPTTRDFSIADQDQSDNVTSTYIITAANTFAQDTAANAALGTRFGNGSDNRLLDVFVDPALGCTPVTAPDLANPGHTATSLGLNELQAMQQDPPVALVPVNDPMTLDAAGHFSFTKTNLYRVGVGQPPLIAIDLQRNAILYCRNLMNIAPTRLVLDAPFTQVSVSPDAGTNLLDFLIARYNASLQNLGCATLTPTNINHESHIDHHQ
jgi:hypothetical protein